MSRKGTRGREKRQQERRVRLRQALVLAGALSSGEAEVLAEVLYGTPADPPKPRPPAPSRKGGKPAAQSKRSRKKRRK